MVLQVYAQQTAVQVEERVAAPTTRSKPVFKLEDVLAARQKLEAHAKALINKEDQEILNRPKVGDGS